MQHVAALALVNILLPSPLILFVKLDRKERLRPKSWIPSHSYKPKQSHQRIISISPLRCTLVDAPRPGAHAGVQAMRILLTPAADASHL